MISIQEVRRQIESVLRDVPGKAEVLAADFAKRLGEPAARLLQRIGAVKVARSGTEFSLMLRNSFQSDVSGLTVSIDCEVGCAVFHSKTSLELVGLRGVKVCKGSLPWVYVTRVLMLESPGGNVTITADITRFGFSDQKTVVIGPDGKLIRHS